jgi:hypothetical protein
MFAKKEHAERSLDRGRADEPELAERLRLAQVELDA